MREANLQVKADRSDHLPRRNDFEKGRVSQGAIHQNVGGNMMRMRDRSQGTVPINVHRNVFDPKNDDNLVLMAVDEVGRDNKWKQDGKQLLSQSDGGTCEVRKVGMNAEIPGKLVDEIMNKQLTIEVGTLLEIVPRVKQGLVAAAQGKSSNPAQGFQKPILTTLTTVGHKDDDKKHAKTSK